jgi:hypothetical protein
VTVASMGLILNVTHSIGQDSERDSHMTHARRDALWRPL